jgi:CRISPR-associated protein Cas5t
MLSIRVKVPVTSFRKGLAREYLETEQIPPPSTCYGFLLSLVGETDRQRHVGVRVAPLVLGQPSVSVVLRTIWRLKAKTLGGKGNTRPDFQQLLCGVDVIMWVDSSSETHNGPNLESLIVQSLDPGQRHKVVRFGGLSLGESTHLVDSVDLLNDTALGRLREELSETGMPARLYRVQDEGLLGLPVWVDHVGSAKTRHVVGDLVEWSDLVPPNPEEMPLIGPEPV